MVARILYFVYGCLAYLLFLATFLYAIAFVGGFAVPTKLDGPATTPFPTALAVDAALLAAFAVQHSVMARHWFKRRWTQIVPWAIERSTYVLFASLALDLLFWQWRPLGGIVWTIDRPAARGLVWAIFAWGWLQVLVMTFYINHFDLFGLRQVWLHLIGRHYTRVGFATPAPYRFVRHPLYLGFLLAFWAAPTMTVAHLVFAVATTAYIVLAIQFEERDLAREHGAAYREYRRRVPMLLPRRRITMRHAPLLTIVALVSIGCSNSSPLRPTPAASALSSPIVPGSSAQNTASAASGATQLRFSVAWTVPAYPVCPLSPPSAGTITGTGLLTVVIRSTSDANGGTHIGSTIHGNGTATDETGARWRWSDADLNNELFPSGNTSSNSFEQTITENFHFVGPKGQLIMVKGTFHITMVDGRTIVELEKGNHEEAEVCESGFVLTPLP